MSRSAKIQLVILAVNLVFWGAIFGWTVWGDQPDRRPDELEDRAFAAAAEPICAETLAAIEGLDLDPVADDPVERAETVDRTNDELRRMIGELRGLPAPEGEQGEWVAAWLDDWETHIADRQSWADGQRRGEDVPFSETDRGGLQISRVIDNFAEVNSMESCATTHDV